MLNLFKLDLGVVFLSTQLIYNKNYMVLLYSSSILCTCD